MCLDYDHYRRVFCDLWRAASFTSVGSDVRSSVTRRTTFHDLRRNSGWHDRNRNAHVNRRDAGDVLISQLAPPESQTQRAARICTCVCLSHQDRDNVIMSSQVGPQHECACVLVCVHV